MSDCAVVVSPYSREYGPARILQYAVAAIAELGLTPICIVPPDARLTPELLEMAPEMHTIPELSTVPRTLNPVQLSRFMSQHVQTAREIESIARAKHASVIYSTSEAILSSGMAARSLGIPSIVHVIGMSIGSPRWTGQVYVRALGALTDMFIACSSQVAEMLASFGVRDDQISVVHHGIPVEEISNVAHDRADLDPARRVGMVGAFDPRKAQELFVSAASVVRHRFPETHFYLIGSTIDGNTESEEYARRVRRLVDELGLAPHTTLAGYLPDHADVYRMMGAMDVIVVPSKTEAFSLVLLESMACGRPIVATRIAGNLDAFVHGFSGLYVDPNAKAIAHGICTVLEDPDLGERMGQRAAERAALLFDVGRTLDTTCEVIGEVLAHPAA